MNILKQGERVYDTEKEMDNHRCAKPLNSDQETLHLLFYKQFTIYNINIAKCILWANKVAYRITTFRLQNLYSLCFCFLKLNLNLITFEYLEHFYKKKPQINALDKL